MTHDAGRMEAATLLPHAVSDVTTGRRSHGLVSLRDLVHQRQEVLHVSPRLLAHVLRRCHGASGDGGGVDARDAVDERRAYLGAVLDAVCLRGLVSGSRSGPLVRACGRTPRYRASDGRGPPAWSILPRGVILRSPPGIPSRASVAGRRRCLWVRRSRSDTRRAVREA